MQTKIIYNESLPVALRQAQEYTGREGYVASLPQLIDLRLEADKTDILWNNRFTTTTEEHVGITKKGNSVLVTSHKQVIWTPDRIDRAHGEGLINGAGKLTEPEFQELLEGDVTITDLEKVKHLPSYYRSLGDLRKDPLFILRVGSEERANKYIDRLKQDGYKGYGNQHIFNAIDPAQPQGRLLFVGNDYCNGRLNGSNYLGYYGRFVGVRPVGAQISAEKECITKPTLEEVLNLSKRFVPEMLHPDFEKTLRSLYK